MSNSGSTLKVEALFSSLSPDPRIISSCHLDPTKTLVFPLNRFLIRTSLRSIKIGSLVMRAALSTQGDYSSKAMTHVCGLWRLGKDGIGCGSGFLGG